jgi:hypothetical protein
MENQNLNSNNLNEEKAPNVMRENNGDNSEPDMADKTIQAVEGFLNTEDHKSKFSNEDLRKYKNMAMICYIPFVSILFMFNAKTKKSDYFLFHTNQGLVVTLLWVASYFISRMLESLFYRKSMVVNNEVGLISFISYILYCACFISTIYGIVTTFNGSSKEIPLLGKIKLLK